MNILPNTKPGFIEWAKAISQDIENEINFKIDYNQLSEIMARNIPGTDDDFDLSSLSDLYESDPSLKSAQELASQHMKLIFSLDDDVGEAILNDEPFHYLNREGALSELFSTGSLPQLTSGQEEYIATVINSYHVEKANNAFGSFGANSSEITNYAYKELLLDSLLELLNFAHTAATFLKLPPKEITPWFDLLISHFYVDFSAESNSEAARLALRKLNTSNL